MRRADYRGVAASQIGLASYAQRRTLHSLLRRPALSARRHGHGRAAGAVRREGRVSRAANLLRPADGQHRLHRRRPAAGRAVRARSFAATTTSSPRRAVAWRWSGITTRNILHGEPGFEELKTQDLRAVRVSGRRAEGRPHRPARFRIASACIKAATACASCGWAARSELVGPPFSKAAATAGTGSKGSSSSTLQRPDECCGFGGTFAVDEEAVSCMMGHDRIHDHEHGRGRSADGQRHVVPDAPGRADPPAEASRSA